MGAGAMRGTAYGSDGLSAEEHARWMAWERAQSRGESREEGRASAMDGSGGASAKSGVRAEAFLAMVMDPKALWGREPPRVVGGDWKEVGDEVGEWNLRGEEASLPTEFSDAREYRSKFLPLMAEEARQMVREAVNEVIRKGGRDAERVGGAVGVLAFPDMTTAGSRGPHTLTLLVEASWKEEGSLSRWTKAQGTVAVLTQAKDTRSIGKRLDGGKPPPRVACLVKKSVEVRRSVVEGAKRLGIGGMSRDKVLLEVTLSFYWAGHTMWSDAGLLTHLSQRVIRQPLGSKPVGMVSEQQKARLRLDNVILLLTDEHLTGSLAECEALGRVEKMPLYSALVSPDARDYPRYEEVRAPSLCGALTPARNSRFESDFFGRKFNPSQQRAIQWGAAHASATAEAMVDDAVARFIRLQKNMSPPFTLIQGPPGTGKSHTIVGMLNVMHVSLMQRYYASKDEIFKRQQTAMQERRGTDRAAKAAMEVTKALIQSREQRPRLLVCAPSNTAVDELVRRIMTEGFIDGELQQYRPDILRVGSSSGIAATDEMVAQVELDTKVNAYLGMKKEELAMSMHALGMHIEVESQKAFALERRLSELPVFESQEIAMDRAPASKPPTKRRVDVDPDALHFSDDESDGQQGPVMVDQRVTSCGPDVGSGAGAGGREPCPAPPLQPEATEIRRLDIAKEERDLKIRLASFGSTIARDMQTHARYRIVHGKYAGAVGNDGGAWKEGKARLDLEMTFVNSAEIVFCTLGTAATKKVFQKLEHGFDIVVVDEAAQACEPEVLPALQLGCKRAVLVGDPRQLPATVLSPACAARGYERSLFERLVLEGVTSTMLSVQYRMHPSIREFPSRRFYGGKLVDGEAPSGVSRPKFLQDSDSPLSPLVFFDVVDAVEKREGPQGKSLANSVEARLVVALWWAARCRVADTGGAGCGTGWGPKSAKPCPIKFGVITPYKQQTKLLERTFEAFCAHVDPVNDPSGMNWKREVRIGTVDSFQGQEEDVVILSCVRGSKKGGIGFVDDPRRMNVAITRPRQALWICGNATTLSRSSEDWAALVDWCKSCESVREVGSKTVRKSCIVQARGSDPGIDLFPEFARVYASRNKKRGRDRMEEVRPYSQQPMAVPLQSTLPPPGARASVPIRSRKPVEHDAQIDIINVDADLHSGADGSDRGRVRAAPLPDIVDLTGEDGEVFGGHGRSSDILVVDDQSLGMTKEQYGEDLAKVNSQVQRHALWIEDELKKYDRKRTKADKDTRRQVEEGELEEGEIEEGEVEEDAKDEEGAKVQAGRGDELEPQGLHQLLHHPHPPPALLIQHPVSARSLQPGQYQSLADAFPPPPGQSGLLQPSSGLLQPAPGPLQPGPGPLQPGPGPLQPGPGLLQPGPGLLQPGPGLLQPGPGLLQPGSGLLQPQPGMLLPAPGLQRTPDEWLQQKYSQGQHLSYPDPSLIQHGSAGLLTAPTSQGILPVPLQPHVTDAVQAMYAAQAQQTTWDHGI